jgi:hypothetical protein
MSAHRRKYDPAAFEALFALAALRDPATVAECPAPAATISIILAGRER